MANFFDQVGDFARDLGNNISGKQKQQAFTASQKAQELYNKTLFDLEAEKIRLQNSPEAQKAKTLKAAMAFGVFIVVVFVSFIILKKT